MDKHDKGVISRMKKERIINIYDSLIKYKMSKISYENDYRKISEYQNDIYELIEKLKRV